MPNVQSVLQEEICRLARKELRGQLAPLAETVRQLKAQVREQRRQLAEFEKQLGGVVRRVGPKKADVTDTDVKKARFSPARIHLLRSKLGLPRSRFAQLVGVTPHAIYIWESGRGRPRAQHKARLVELRAMGKREIKVLLASLPSKPKAGTESDG